MRKPDGRRLSRDFPFIGRDGERHDQRHRIDELFAGLRAQLTDGSPPFGIIHEQPRNEPFALPAHEEIKRALRLPRLRDPTLAQPGADSFLELCRIRTARRSLVFEA